MSSEPSLPDLSSTATADLFSLYRSILTELRARKVIRTENAPAGDYAEYLVAAALRGELALNSEKSWDVLAAGTKVQVKARVVSDPPTRSQRQLSPFRSFDFDTLVIVLLRSHDYSVHRAVQLPADVVRELSRTNNHVNGQILHATNAVLEHDLAIDLTPQLSAVS